MRQGTGLHAGHEEAGPKPPAPLAAPGAPESAEDGVGESETWTFLEKGRLPVEKRRRKSQKLSGGLEKVKGFF